MFCVKNKESKINQPISIHKLEVYATKVHEVYVSLLQIKIVDGNFNKCKNGMTKHYNKSTGKSNFNQTNYFVISFHHKMNTCFWLVFRLFMLFYLFLQQFSCFAFWVMLKWTKTFKIQQVETKSLKIHYDDAHRIWNHLFKVLDRNTIILI